MKCIEVQKSLPDLLLAGLPLPPDVSAHLKGCVPCERELTSFQATLALLDEWQAPEPSPYFDQRLTVRLREETAAQPAGWLERLQFRMLFNTGAQFRPVLAGTLAALLIMGGGAFAGLSTVANHRGGTQVSAAVDDLQILDKNDQVFQQMDQLLQDDPASDDVLSIAPRT